MDLSSFTKSLLLKLKLVMPIFLQMAKAGFVHCPSENEPDVACCFYCLRELEGWEPEDNPWWAPAAHLTALFFWVHLLLFTCLQLYTWDCNHLLWVEKGNAKSTLNDINLFYWLSLRSEHAKRSPNCGFLHMKKTFDNLTAIEYFQLEQERLRIYIVSMNENSRHTNALKQQNCTNVHCFKWHIKTGYYI